MNPLTIATSFSIQKISKHHFLIRGDDRVGDFMDFCDIKWSDTYMGWIVHQDDEVDLIQMHLEILDVMKEERDVRLEKNRKKNNVKIGKKVESSKKKKATKKLNDYDKIKLNIDVSDTEDDEYIPSSSCDNSDDETYDPENSEETDSEELSEDEETDSEEQSEDEETDSEEQSEDEKTRPNENVYQFYKKGILAFGKMDRKIKNKVDAVWNKHLEGFIIRKSYQQKLEKYGWKEIANEEPINNKKKSVETKMNKKSTEPSPISNVSSVCNERTFAFYKNIIHVSGPMKDYEETQLDAILNPALNGYMVTKNYLQKLLDLGFTERDLALVESQPITVKFSDVEKLIL